MATSQAKEVLYSRKACMHAGLLTDATAQHAGWQCKGSNTKIHKLPICCASARRRAKRLKKLKAMLNSSLAQQAFNSWRWRTLLLLAVIVIAHIVGFGVLENEIASRRL